MILIQIISRMKAGMKTCSSMKNLWSNNGTVKKAVLKQLQFLLSRITRYQTKEEKKALKETIQQQTKSIFKGFTKKSSASSSLFELRFPFTKNKLAKEVEIANRLDSGEVIHENQFQEQMQTESSRPGKHCLVQENANEVGNDPNRRKLL